LSSFKEELGEKHLHISANELNTFAKKSNNRHLRKTKYRVFDR